MKGLIILAVIVGLLLLAALLWMALRSGGVRRRDFERMSKQLGLAEDTLDKIDTHTSLYKDIESPLSSAIRTEFETYRKERKKIK